MLDSNSDVCGHGKSESGGHAGRGVLRMLTSKGSIGSTKWRPLRGISLPFRSDGLGNRREPRATWEAAARRDKKWVSGDER